MKYIKIKLLYCDEVHMFLFDIHQFKNSVSSPAVAHLIENTLILCGSRSMDLRDISYEMADCGKSSEVLVLSAYFHWIFLCYISVDSMFPVRDISLMSMVW